MNASKSHFDFAIVGAGMAGLQLAMGLIEDPFFDQFKFAIFESRQEYTNDRTWCFLGKRKR